MELIFQTRFSFFGVSGWQSTASQSEEALFAPERLNKRFDLFESVALACLKDQTNQDFRLAVLSSVNLPQKYKDRLNELCKDTLGAERCDIYYCGPRKAGRLFRKFMCEKYPDDRTIAQVVLDDDDAVSCDFVDICKREAEFAVSNNYDGTDGVYLTFPRGLSMGIENQRAQWLAPRNAFFTNLGLTLVAPPTFKRHPFLTSHRQIGNRFTSRAILTARPFYIRAIHDENDSDAKHRSSQYSPEQIVEYIRYFPFLKNHFPDGKPTNLLELDFSSPLP